MFYLDTSFVVASLSSETSTITAQHWLDDHLNSTLVCTAWVHVEVVSALGLKVRANQMNQGQHGEVIAAWENLRQDSLTVLPILPNTFDTAAKFLTQHELGLRSGDALHLAVAALSNLSLVTFDRRMAAAAAQLGIVVEPL